MAIGLMGGVGRSVNHLSADGTGKTILHGIVDVDEEVRGRGVLAVLTLEDLVKVLDLGHVFVVVLAPDVLLEVVNVDVIVTKGNGTGVDEDRKQPIGQVLEINKLAGYHGLRVLNLVLNVCTQLAYRPPSNHIVDRRGCLTFNFRPRDLGKLAEFGH